MAVMETGAGEVKEIGRGVRLRQGWVGLRSALLDLVYPPGCAACSAPLTGAQSLCASCFAGLRQISAPLCPVLGIPFETDLGPETRSAEALADPPPFARARAAVSSRQPLAMTITSGGRGWVQTEPSSADRQRPISAASLRFGLSTLTSTNHP